MKTPLHSFKPQKVSSFYPKRHRVGILWAQKTRQEWFLEEFTQICLGIPNEAPLTEHITLRLDDSSCGNSTWVCKGYGPFRKRNKSVQWNRTLPSWRERNKIAASLGEMSRSRHCWQNTTARAAMHNKKWTAFLEWHKYPHCWKNTADAASTIKQDTAATVREPANEAKVERKWSCLRRARLTRQQWRWKA